MRRMMTGWVCLATVLTASAAAHRFEGAWITDGEMAAQAPRNVKARQLERDKLSPVNKELRNRHILFRRKFELGKASNAQVFITADDYYKLYVNGRFVGQGPAAGTPEHTYYNAIDVTKYLKAGENVVAVHTYYQGLVNRVWVSGDNRHGLIMDLVADGKTVLASDASFKTARHGAYSAMGTVGYQTQFMERYDASAQEVEFEQAKFDDSSWAKACVNPNGRDYRLYPQPTPMLAFDDIRPVKTWRAANGNAIFDFGGIYVGAAVFSAKGKRGDAIRILCGQELQADGGVRHKMRCNCDYVEEMVLSGGKGDVLNPFDYKSFRYMELAVPEGAEVDVESVVLKARHMPFELKAAPNFGDDAELAKVWKLCVDTFKWGVQEQIQDCMDREKGYYLGDGCYTMYAYCKLTGDWTSARRFFDDFLRTRDVDRGLVTCANCAFMQEIAEYPLMMIKFAEWYMEETGDYQFIRERYDAFADILDSYRERYAREDGLLTNLDKWCVVEWPKNFQDGYDADVREGKVCTDVHNVINAWYIGAVKTMNSMAAGLGRKEYAEAAKLESAFRKVFWDGKRGLFRDREGSSHISMPGNVYAAFFDLAPRNRMDAFKANFLKLVRGKRFSSISLFQFFPLFSYLEAKGERALLMELMKSPDAWLRIIREDGTRTFEGWGRDTKWNTSLFHLTVAAAACFLCDREPNETAAIQARIDAASANGGGTVAIEAGVHPISRLELKSNVTLELKEGAILQASTNKSDYAKGENQLCAVLTANGATNIAVVGKGEVDGRGWALFGTEHDGEKGRWKDVLFYHAKGVRIEGITLRNSASWTCYLRECEDVVVRKVTIRSLWNWNNDGIDIDAKNVLVEDCDIDSDDDAICPKSDNSNFICENVEVRNCRLASNCNHIKLGTSSRGGFRNIWIHDCELVQSATNRITQIKNRQGRANDIPGWDKNDIASRVGIAVECVDGGILENVRISDIRMTRCCQTPILVRLGRRRDHPKGLKSYLKDVVIENVSGESASWLASSITGVPGLRPENVTIRNVKLKVKGGGPASEVERPVPEAEKKYPENRMFGRQMLPAYGFYVRHADNVKFENVEISYTGESEGRPAIVADDSTGVVTTNCRFRKPVGGLQEVLLR